MGLQGMGGNGNYFSGINGNGIKVPKTAVGMGMKSWEWEGMVCKNLFPHISTCEYICGSC